jgi:hypothetical protein
MAFPAGFELGSSCLKEATPTNKEDTILKQENICKEKSFC